MLTDFEEKGHAPYISLKARKDRAILRTNKLLFMNTFSSPSLERAPPSPEVQHAQDFFDRELAWILPEQEIRALGLYEKMATLKQFYDKDWQPTLQWLQHFLKQNQPQEQTKRTAQEEAALFKNNLLQHIPDENILRFFLAPKRAKRLSAEALEALNMAEIREDVDWSLIPLSLVMEYFENPEATPRVLGFHTSNYAIHPGQSIKPGSMPESFGGKASALPETGWTWYSYGRHLYTDQGKTPTFLHIIEGKSSDFSIETNQHDSANAFIGVRRPLRVLESIDLRKDSHLAEALGFSFIASANRLAA